MGDLSKDMNFNFLVLHAHTRLLPNKQEMYRHLSRQLSGFGVLSMFRAVHKVQCCPKNEINLKGGGRGSEPMSYFLSPPDNIDLFMDPEFQCLVSFVLGGRGGGSGKNDHKFRFLGNTELYEQPLTGIEFRNFPWDRLCRMGRCFWASPQSLP